jgi:hypothetical protein
MHASAMDRLGDVTARRALLLLGAFIVVGGFALALYSQTFGMFGTFSAASNNVALSNNGSNAVNGGVSFVAAVPGSTNQPGFTQVIMTTTMATSTTNGNGGFGTPHAPGSNFTGTTSGTGSLVELSSDLTIQSAKPADAASAVVALAYSVGGYVAYQSTTNDGANVVIRIPAADFADTLAKVKALGTFVSLTSNSNDVTVQYTDLNATLASLKTEEGALLRLLNQSSNINSTLAIENELQGVDTQINEVESQILQTRTLVAYSTIDVTVVETAGSVPLSMALKASQTGGTAPLSVTFNAIVKGGTQPYYIIYNFGDGTSDQGQILIHTFTQSGTYNVTVSVTDVGGNTSQAWTVIHVGAAPSQGIGGFFGTVSNLFVSVVEGIVEVAAVVLPLAAVGAVILIPLRRRGRPQKDFKQSQ